MLKHDAQDSSDELEGLLTVREIADHLRVHISTIYRLSYAGRLKAMRLGGVWRFKLSEVMGALQKDGR